MAPATGLLIQLTLLTLLLAVLVTLAALEYLRRLRAAGGVLARPAPRPAVDITPLPGAAHALANPPDLAATLAELQRRYAHRAYTIPLGWQALDGRPVCVVGHLVDDLYHLLVTAKSRAGKDTAVISWLLALALANPPSRLQLAILDGKGGLEWVGWRGKAHTWLLAIDADTVAPAMAALTRERERRARILRQVGVSAWERYQGSDLPLLVVYVSELLLLQDATSPKELERWLNTELSSAGALGLRYIVATQTATHFATRWRSQVDLCYAGYQPSASQDTPNTGLTADEIVRAGGVPPSQLPELPRGRGVFTAVQGRLVETVRVAAVSDAERTRWLAQLPDAPRTHNDVSSVSTAKAADQDLGYGAALPMVLAPERPAAGLQEASAAIVVTSVSTQRDAGNASGNGGGDQGTAALAGNDGNAVGNAAGNAADLTDEEVIALLVARTPTRRIAAKMRGRMERRLRRIAALRATLRTP